MKANTMDGTKDTAAINKITKTKAENRSISNNTLTVLLLVMASIHRHIDINKRKMASYTSPSMNQCFLFAITHVIKPLIQHKLRINS